MDDADGITALFPVDFTDGSGGTAHKDQIFEETIVKPGDFVDFRGEEGIQGQVGFGQVQGGRQPGVAGTDDADIGFDTPVQRRARRLRPSARCCPSL